ncbi:MAG: tetratricopeptide repeat protein [Spirochaetales bacterium]|nr:tetratricopeptide repeat protein [Spirochaetales bacterium]
MKTLPKLLALLAAALLFVNADTTAATSPGGAIAQVNSDHYRIFYQGSDEDARLFGAKMESCLELYNSVLHFDLAKLLIKLKVRIFSDKSGFDAYLKSVVKETKDDFVYIHYTDLARCELVGFQKTVEADFYTALLHQGAVQFLKAYVSNPPLWLQEGLAAYFEQSQFNEEKNKFDLPSDLIWLTSLKKLVKGDSENALISFDSFLVIDKTQAQADLASFYPEAWGLVYFLLHSQDSNINRILWDSIAALDPALSVKDNSARVMDKAFSWYGVDKIETAFKDYYNGLKTLSDLVAEGVSYYSGNELDKARESFTQAEGRNPDNYIPYYYLGLISYNKKDYGKAETLYLKALDLKAPAALINYAIGVNAYADNNYDKAATYLKNAKTEDPKNYGDKVDTILSSIEGETAGGADVSPSPNPSPAPAPEASPAPVPDSDSDTEPLDDEEM